MHQSLDGLPQRVVLDANVLLNACFVISCSARQAISELRNLGFQPIIDHAIEYEVLKILLRLRIKCGLHFDPAAVFRQYLVMEKILVLPSAPDLNHKKINRADRHVFAAAKEYKAWILTGDVHFMAECTLQEQVSRLPMDVVMESVIRQKRNPPLNYILRFAGISQYQGSIFARISPGGWGGTTSEGIFTVCEIENVMTLFYDAKRSNWCLTIKNSGADLVSFPVKDERPLVICASFKISSTDKIGKAELRICSSSGECQAKGFPIAGGPNADSPGQIAFGHGVNHSNHLNGHIRSIVVSPNPISKRLWNALRSSPNANPDPASGNILEAALRKTQVVGGKYIVPNEYEIARRWV